jgi:hypothetical protein
MGLLSDISRRSRALAESRSLARKKQRNRTTEIGCDMISQVGLTIRCPQGRVGSSPTSGIRDFVGPVIVPRCRVTRPGARGLLPVVSLATCCMPTPAIGAS